MRQAPEGFTQQIFATGDFHDLELLIRPGTDLDGTFKAWDINEGELLRINGWLFSFEP